MIIKRYIPYKPIINYILQNVVWDLTKRSIILGTVELKALASGKEQVVKISSKELNVPISTSTNVR